MGFKGSGFKIQGVLSGGAAHFVILSGEKRRVLRKRCFNRRIRFHMDFYT